MLYKVVKKLWAEFLPAEFGTLWLVAQEPQVRLQLDSAPQKGPEIPLDGILMIVGDCCTGGEISLGGIFTCGIFNLFGCKLYCSRLQTPISTPKLYINTAGLKFAYEQVTSATPERTYRHQDPLLATSANSTSKQSDNLQLAPLYVNSSRFEWENGQDVDLGSWIMVIG